MTASRHRYSCDALGACQGRSPRCADCPAEPCAGSQVVDEFTQPPPSAAERWRWRLIIVATYAVSAALTVGPAAWLVYALAKR